MGFKRKFQIGDKVRVIKTNNFRYNQIGKIQYYYSSYNSKGIYSVRFKNGTWNYYPNDLEKVEDSSNTKSNKLSISDLKPGMKVRIRPDLKKGQSTIIYIMGNMENCAGAIMIIKKINSNNTITLNDSGYVWDIDCFSEIVKESEEETTTSQELQLPLKEGQVVTLLDGKKYQVINNNTKKSPCDFCCLCIRTCGEDRCNITHINGKSSCTLVIPTNHYFKLYKEQKIEDNFSNSVEESSIKEIGIITKVNFTLTDFKSEELVHSKFTIL